MKTMRNSVCLSACVAAILVVALSVEPVSAQVYYNQYVVSGPAYPLPNPNYVVYSPSFLAWRSAGYYGGNWGPYYYDPPALYPYISGTTIWPTVTPAYPPPTGWPYWP